MSEVEQRRERLPSGRAFKNAGAAQRRDDADASRVAKMRRNAWLLGGLALFFYVGYIAWMFIRANGG